jgi:hypothetical protein
MGGKRRARGKQMVGNSDQTPDKALRMVIIKVVEVAESNIDFNCLPFDPTRDKV